MHTIGTKINYRGHTGRIKFVCEYAIVFTVGESTDKLREVNMVVYPHSFNDITVIE